MSMSLDVILDATEIIAVAGPDQPAQIRCGRCGRPALAHKPTIGAILWAAVHDCPARGQVLAEVLAFAQGRTPAAVEAHHAA